MLLLAAATAGYHLSASWPAADRPRCAVAAAVPPCSIKVIGIGGGGGNTVNRMVDAVGTESGVDFALMNTDVQALSESRAPETLQIGPECTRGLGAGGRPEVGEEAALESRAAIAECVAGRDMVFVTAGMGGGTGSGAAAVGAQVAREAGALTVGVVSRPFGFEGGRRSAQAQAAVERLSASVDMLIVVANDMLLEIIPPGVSLADSFALADEVLRESSLVAKIDALYNLSTQVRRNNFEKAVQGLDREAILAPVRQLVFADQDVGKALNGFDKQFIKKVCGVRTILAVPSELKAQEDAAAAAARGAKKKK